MVSLREVGGKSNESAADIFHRGCPGFWRASHDGEEVKVDDKGKAG